MIVKPMMEVYTHIMNILVLLQDIQLRLILRMEHFAESWLIVQKNVELFTMHTELQIQYAPSIV